MNIDALYPTSPRGDEARQLADLIALRHEVAGRVDAVERQQRAATERRDRASEELAALEARDLSGESIDASERKRVETALSKAKALAAEPWPERRAGASRAVTEADARIGRFVAENYRNLAAEVAEDGESAARTCDAACAALIEAVTAREQVAARAIALAAFVRRTRPGDVAFSRCEPVVREARRVLEGGGETAPAPPGVITANGVA